MSLPSYMALFVALAACVFDLRTQRIPNALTFGAACAAALFHGLTGGPAGFLEALSGWSIGMALFLPFYLLRGLGAGDVKLLAAFGAWLGSSMAVSAALWGGIAGGVLALIVAGTGGYLRQSLSNVWLLLTHWRVVGLGPVTSLSIDSPEAPRLAYAVPMTAGLVAALWLR